MAVSGGNVVAPSLGKLQAHAAASGEAASWSNGSARCHSSISPSSATARMNASVTATLMLKFDSEPSRLAWMKSSTSGWSQRSMPICAPRRAPADSSVSQLLSNTRMYDNGPLAREWVPCTSAPRGRIAEKS